MRKFLLCTAVLALGLVSLGQIRVLVVDESKSLEESLRLLAAVRALKASGAFHFQAVLEFPQKPWAGEPFHVVVYIPTSGPYIWFCSPWPESFLPEEFRRALWHLKEALTQAFSSLRKLRGPAEDLYPLLLGLTLASLGYMGGGR